MKRSTQWFVAVSAIIVLLACAAPAKADPITYKLTGTGSGTIGGLPFTDALVTVTLTGNTSNVTSVALFPGPNWLVNVGTTTINIPGIGLANVTDATAMYSSVVPFAGAPTFGLPVLPYVLLGQLDHPPATNSQTSIAGMGSDALLGYNLQTSIGPITSSLGGLATPPSLIVHTNLGNLVFDVNPLSGGTFTATTTPVPEPSTLSLLAVGVVALVGSRSHLWLRIGRHKPAGPSQ
jgi:hypothetical protein